MKRAERAVLVALVTAVALGLRLAYVAHSHTDQPLRADAGQYARCAQNLLQHGTFSVSTAVPPPPDALRSPGYPAFLAAVRSVAGDHWYQAVRFCQAVLGALAVPLAFWLARIVLPFALALAAALAVALSPHLVVASGYVLTEGLQAPLFAAALLLFAHAMWWPSLGRVLLAGAVFGALALVNETAAPLPLVLALVARHQLGVGGALLFVVMAALPVAGWQVRNATTPLAIAPTARAVATLSHGSYPDLFYATEAHRDYPYEEDPEQPAFGASWDRFTAIMQRRVAAAPWTYARWYLVDKPRWLWRWDIVQGAGDAYVYPVPDSWLREQPVLAAVGTAQRWLHAPFVLLCLLGIAVTLRRRADLGRAETTVLRAPAAALLAFTAIHALFLPDPRYLVPLRPLQAVLAAAGAWWLWQAARRLRSRSQSRSDGLRDRPDGGGQCRSGSTHSATGGAAHGAAIASADRTPMLPVP